MKMQSTRGAWIITDKDVVKKFDNATDAWWYVLLMKEVREHTTHIPKTLYPVHTLDPVPSTMIKKVTI